MKQHIFPALRLTLICLIVFTGLYTLLIFGIAQVAPNNGKGETVTVNNKVVGYKLEGQSFTADNYFQSRPSAAGYNAAGSSGSNKGPSNPEYLKQVEERTDTFLIHNPGVKKQNIPSEIVTASGSGLDPDISPEAAYIQAKRIGTVRGLPEQQVNALIENHIEQPLLGIFGTSKINLLKLNIDLDKIKNRK